MKYLILPLLLLLASCQTSIPKCPECKFWAGDSSIGGITRKQDDKSILATDLEFDNYLAIHSDGFKEFMRVYVHGCKVWKSPYAKDLALDFWTQNSVQLQPQK